MVKLESLKYHSWSPFDLVVCYKIKDIKIITFILPLNALFE